MRDNEGRTISQLNESNEGQSSMIDQTCTDRATSGIVSERHSNNSCIEDPEVVAFQFSSG